MDNMDFLLVNSKALRQLEEIAETLDERIIKKLPEDKALFLLAFDCEEGFEFTEKYEALVNDMVKLRDELIDCARVVNDTEKLDRTK